MTFSHKEGFIGRYAGWLDGWLGGWMDAWMDGWMVLLGIDVLI